MFLEQRQGDIFARDNAYSPVNCLTGAIFFWHTERTLEGKNVQSVGGNALGIAREEKKDSGHG
jgi:hypothetical protein